MEITAPSVLLQEQDKQFKVLMQDLAWWSEHAPATGDTTLAKGIRNCLGEMTSFFQEYYDYFKSNAGQLPDDRPLYTVLRTVVRKLLEQSDTITRVLAQRRSESPYSDELLDADKQAKQHYDRFTGFKPSSDRPIVYYEKQYQITRFAYGPPPIIAIPLADRGLSTLPVAHEEGHYVYWNGVNSRSYRAVRERFTNMLTTRLEAGCLKEFLENTAAGTSRGPVMQRALEQLRRSLDDPNVESQLKQARTRWEGWLEETFADVFGTLVAGMDFAKSSQSRLLRDIITSDSDLMWDDSQHPAAALRPFIATETLRYIGIPTKDIDDLEAAWGTALEKSEVEFQKQIAQMHAVPVAQQPNGLKIPPSPKVMAGMIPVLVEGLLKEKILPNAALDPTPLLDMVVPFGKPLDLRAARAASSRRRLIDGKNSAFTELHNSVQDDIAGGRETRPEWQALLDLELTSGRASDHWLPDTHPHAIRHFHNWQNDVICC